MRWNWRLVTRRAWRSFKQRGDILTSRRTGVGGGISGDFMGEAEYEKERKISSVVSGTSGSKFFSGINSIGKWGGFEGRGFTGGSKGNERVGAPRRAQSKKWTGGVIEKGDFLR